MKFLNCSLNDTKERFAGKKIIFFGAGSWLSIIDDTKLMELKSQFAYIVDNSPRDSIQLGDCRLHIFYPNKIREEKECIVILTSPVFMYDMYCQLEEMKLSDNIECYAFPFMQMVTEYRTDPKLLARVTDRTRQPHILKLIHSFWFSGEEKPKKYQRCVDSWTKRLPGYEIKEWNLHNYDWHKHPFLERAIEMKAWAFASDFARLDVLNEYGGIYLDMDVEVFKPFDDLLGNETIFSFGNNVLIDLAVVGAKKQNPIIQELLELYDNVPLPKERKDYIDLFQPKIVRPVLASHGIRMDGSLQIMDGVTVFPTEFFMPQDAILYRQYERTEYTYCVHYDNFGWSFGTNNKQEKKRHDNNLLWNILDA